MYSRDYTKYSPEHFIDDVSIQIWNYDLDNYLMLFVWRLEDCVDRIISHDKD